jgi:Ca2+-binding EF-hand superfamily protein
MKKTTVSIVQGSSRLGSSSFRAQDYERGGVSNDEIQEIKEAFDLFDPTRSGTIRPAGTPFCILELQAALASLGSESTNQPIYQIISDLVEEGRGEIDFNDFLDLMTQRVSNKDTR